MSIALRAEHKEIKVIARGLKTPSSISGAAQKKEPRKVCHVRLLLGSSRKFMANDLQHHLPCYAEDARVIAHGSISSECRLHVTKSPGDGIGILRRKIHCHFTRGLVTKERCL